MDKDIVLEIKDLSVEYKTDLETVKAINGISFKVEKGETLGIVGETGAGKTTTALSIMNLLPQPVGRITNGRILVQGQDVYELSAAEMCAIRGDIISMIFQDPMSALNPIMTVGDQIRESLIVHYGRTLDKGQIEKKVEEALEMVGIPASRKNNYPMQFSGGMKQRVVIAIALACSPVLLIADEPTTALDVTIQAQVLSLINDLKKIHGTSVIMITHDLGVVAHTCSKVAVMYAGKIVEYGSVYDIFDMEKPHHPYTIGLFSSLPSIANAGSRLLAIPGQIPDPTALPKGCSFAPRCACKMETCDFEQPELHEFGEHKISCFNFVVGGVPDEQ